MAREQVEEIVKELGLIDLGDVILYLDEAGDIEAAFSTSTQADTCAEQSTAAHDVIMSLIGIKGELSCKAKTLKHRLGTSWE